MATYAALAPSGIALAFAALLGAVAVLLGFLRFAGESAKSLALAASIGTDMSKLTHEDLDAAAHSLNRRPRQTLGWKTPSQKLAETLQ